MDDVFALLREFIETAGYDIETFNNTPEQTPEMTEGGIFHINQMDTYKVTKRQRKAQTPTNAYTDDFNCLWNIYPKRVGSNSKVDAYRAYRARIANDSSHQVIMDGVVRYKAHCEATKSIGTKYVLQASTFMGKSEHYLNAWEVTKEMTMIKLPANNDDLMAFASKYKLPQPPTGMKWPAYRELLQSKINLLNEG